MITQRSHMTRGYATALVTALLLSTTAPFIRYLTQTYDLPPLVLAFWRDVFGTLSLLLILGLFRPSLARADRRLLLFLLAFGLTLAVFNCLWTLSVAMNGAAVSTVLAYSSAAFTALLGHWLLKEDLGWAKLLAVLASLAGCVLVSGAYLPSAWRANLLGILTGAFSGLLYAIYTLMGRTASQRGLNPWTSLLYAFGFASLFLLLLNLLAGRFLPGAASRPADFFWLGNSLAGWGILFLLAAGPTLAGYGMYNVSLSYLPSSVANLIMTLEPAFTALIAYAFLAERLTWVQIAGSLIIIGGVVFLRIYEGRQAL